MSSTEVINCHESDHDLSIAKLSAQMGATNDEMQLYAKDTSSLLEAASSTPTTTDSSAQQLRQISVVKMLGEGSQGRVALCKYADEPHSELFAVKVFNHFIEGEDANERAVRLGHL